MAAAQGLQRTLADINTPDVSRACHAATVFSKITGKETCPTMKWETEHLLHEVYTQEGYHTETVWIRVF